MITLYLLRHAQPAWEQNGKSTYDPPLSQEGQRQAKDLIPFLSSQSWSKVLSSPLKRAQQTLNPWLQSDPTASKTIAEWLTEIRVHHQEGLPKEKILAYLKENRNRPLSQWQEGFTQGDPYNPFFGQVTQGFNELLWKLGFEKLESQGTDLPPRYRARRDCTSQQVLLAAHIGVFSTLIHYLLSHTPCPWSWENLDLGHANYAKLVLNSHPEGDFFQLKQFNPRPCQDSQGTS